MKYIVKNYSLNKVFVIDQQAINAIVKRVIDKTNTIIIDDYEVKVNTKNNSFSINISLWIKYIKDVSNIIRDFTRAIDLKCYSFLNIKPTNILINIRGVK